MTQAKDEEARKWWLMALGMTGDKTVGSELRAIVDSKSEDVSVRAIARRCEYPVPTIDHVWLPPGGRRVAISDDRGIVVVLPALMISGLVHAGNGQAGAAEA